MCGQGEVADHAGGLLSRRRGRPCQISETDRRNTLIQAAEDVFLASGYTAANVEEIAKRAGMSKKTVYRLFDTKEALFGAVIGSRCAALRGALHETDGSPEEIRQVLTEFLTTLARFVLQPRQAALYRLVIAEARRSPELAHAFYCEGPLLAQTGLAAWLAKLHERGTRHIPDAMAAASMLMSMTMSEPQMRVLLCEATVLTDADIDARVALAVDLFLNGTLPPLRAKDRLTATYADA